jgi:hypothetical protein
MQVDQDEEDYQKWFRHISKGGWPFSTKDHGWPISDCTAEGLKVALEMGYHYRPGSPRTHKDEGSRGDLLSGVVPIPQNSTWDAWYMYLKCGVFITEGGIELVGSLLLKYKHTQCLSIAFSPPRRTLFPHTL